MIPAAQSIEDLTLDVTEEIHVRAPLDVTFTALLEQLGPHNEVGEGTPMPMKIEPWPGGSGTAIWATATVIFGATSRLLSGPRCSRSAGRCSCLIRSSQMCSTA